MEESDIEVRTYFAREMNALVARGDFSELYAAWYLHRMDNGLTVHPEAEEAGRDALAALTLHCAGRPWRESCAWTVRFASPRVDVFVAGDNNTGTLIGRVQAGGEGKLRSGIFHADVVEDGRPPRRSVVDFKCSSFFEAVEAFYERSEQRPTRIFRYDEEDIVMISAQPDCDLEWLRGLTDADIKTLDRDIDLSLLETRKFVFRCGCNQDRMLDFMAPIFRREAEGLFGGDSAITIHCPRCGARHVLTREALEARCARGDE